MSADKLKNKQSPKKSSEQKRPEDQKAQPQRESLKFHGDKLEHHKSK